MTWIPHCRRGEGSGVECGDIREIILMKIRS
jgi:hypothetical protein